MATIITTIEGLDAIRNNLAGDYELGIDLDFNDDSSYADPLNKPTYTTGLGWVPIGDDNNEFIGIFDGKGYTISNLYANNTVAALFYTLSSATIQNLIIDLANITGTEGGGY